jgi:hypothetical protein
MPRPTKAQISQLREFHAAVLKLFEEADRCEDRARRGELLCEAYDAKKLYNKATAALFHSKATGFDLYRDSEGFNRFKAILG